MQPTAFAQDERGREERSEGMGEGVGVGSVFEEDVDGGGGGVVDVGVAAAGDVFHDADIASAEGALGAVAGADFDLAGEVDDEAAFGEGW